MRVVQQGLKYTHSDVNWDIHSRLFILSAKK